MKSDSNAVSWEQLCRVCDPDRFSFATTAEVTPLREVLGQHRAVRGIHFGLEISSPGFNVFLAGLPGTGKTVILKRIVEEVASSRKVPRDVCYVHNFDDADSPRVLRLRAGDGAALKGDLDELVRDLHEIVPNVFDGKDYQEQVREIVEANQNRKQEFLDELSSAAKEAGFHIRATPMGFQSIPLRDGEEITQEEYDKLDPQTRERLKALGAKLQERIRDFVREIKGLEKELKENLRDLNRKVATHILETKFAELKARYGDHDGVLEYLEKMESDLVDHIDLFRQQEETAVAVLGLPTGKRGEDLSRYRVNLLIDNSALEGAPVVFETNPTYTNLVGRIEKRPHFGTLVTDFTMIRAGSLVRANGGFLIVEIEDLLGDRFAYEALKRSIKNKEVRIEDLPERLGLVTGQTLRPEPVPLDVKICLVGRPLFYHLLYAYDEDFRESFKVKADFDYQSDRTDEAILEFGSFVARIVDEEKLPHLDRSALARVIDERSRHVEDQEKLSMCLSEANDLIREAAYWARKDGASTISAAHVGKAVDEAEYRSSLVKERVQELIQQDVLEIATTGSQVGQVNGLAVHMVGDYVFGRPTKITAVAHAGGDGVINIERRVQLSHSSHDKGILILSGFVGERFAQERPIAFSASIAFEQSYGEIAGDSASTTELYALLSAISGLPIRQGIAVTGSVNQKGEVQSIGGVNQKIEGFFDVCAARSLTGEQGVIIPKPNLRNLMLRRRVVDAVQSGRFHVWAVSHVDDGIEILTGVPAGSRDDDGVWTKGSVNALVEERLQVLGVATQSWNQGKGGPPGEVYIQVSEEAEEPGREPPPPPSPPPPPPDVPTK